ncbi:MAG: alpha/beta fold hydrolase, partial [Marinirhabdus sp.]
MLLHSKIMGEGKPLIILHGFLGTGDNWKTLGNRFAAAGFQVHLLDQRNHGRSFHSDTFNYPAMAGDVLHYLDAHNIETSRVMGHSMGGKTAMQLAVAHPQRVSRLVVVDISPKAYPQHHQDILKGLNSLDFNTISSRAEADGALGDYIKDPGVRQFLLKNLYWKEKGVLGLRINLPALTENTQNIGRPLP